MASPSLPFRAALSLVLFAGFYVLGVGVAALLLVFAFFLVKEGRAVGVKLACGCLAGAGALLYSLRPRTDKFEPPGPRVTERDQPELFAVIRDVSDAAGQPMPHDVFLVADVNAGVANRGGTLGIGGERVMTLGLALMQMLSVGELKAVIAHELGHFSGGDTNLARIVHRTRSAIGRTLEETRGRLVERPFRAYGALFMWTSMAVSRSQEFAADAFAARVTDPRLLASGLEKVERVGALFLFYRRMELERLLSAGFRAPMAAGFERFLDHPLAQMLTKSSATVAAPRSAYDSHPPTSDRVAALAAMPLNARPLDTAPSIALLRNLSQLEAVVLAAEGVESGKLIEIPWADVVARVRVPGWRQIVTEQAEALRGIQVDVLPSSAAELVVLGQRIDASGVVLANDDELRMFMMNVVSCAVALRLFEAEWTVLDLADVHLESGECVVQPFQLIPDVLSGDAAACAEWLRICRTAALSGPLLVATPSPSE